MPEPFCQVRHNRRFFNGRRKAQIIVVYNESRRASVEARRTTWSRGFFGLKLGPPTKGLNLQNMSRMPLSQ